MAPYDEAAAILNHYFAQLARASGLRWSERNQADIGRAAELLAQADPLPGDDIPPYQPPIRAVRVTQVLAQSDPAFDRWRSERNRNDEEATNRMLKRNGNYDHP